MTELEFTAHVGEALRCGCSVSIDKTNGKAEVLFCGEDHSYYFWMHWSEALEPPFQDPDFPAQADDYP